MSQDSNPSEWVRRELRWMGKHDELVWVARWTTGTESAAQVIELEYDGKDGSSANARLHGKGGSEVAKEIARLLVLAAEADFEP